MFFDCGEGSYAQIYRLYGPEETDNILKKTKAIFISHLHADHHIGLIEILKRRRPLNSAPILLCAPQQIYPWLFYYDLHIERISDTYDLIPNAELVRNQRNAMRFKEIGLNNIQTCFVRHCPYAFAVSVEMCNNTVSAIFNQPKIKITYSGDTIPCRNLVELGKNSTVLIHEATMEDDMEQEARYKMHSTVSQAIEQGEDMNAKYTILTHFSQRYAKIPRMDEDVDDNVAIAFDNMEVSLINSIQFVSKKILIRYFSVNTKRFAIASLFLRSFESHVCRTLPGNGGKSFETPVQARAFYSTQFSDTCSGNRESRKFN